MPRQHPLAHMNFPMALIDVAASRVVWRLDSGLSRKMDVISQPQVKVNLKSQLHGVVRQVFRLLHPSSLSAEGLTEQSDLHGPSSIQMAVDPLVCPSTSASILNTLLLANLSLHCVECLRAG